VPDIPHGKSLVLFDGVCNLCHRSVQFILDRDPAERFVFAALQSAPARRLLAARGYTVAPDPDSVLLVEGGRLYERSTAALRIARRLRGAWPLLFGLIVLPRFLRDAVYRFIARNRYRWFGKRAECRLSTPALRARFLDGGDEAE
jgi:predicted DCC family thiol-disulfide oxidoreductase YuxK